MEVQSSELSLVPKGPADEWAELRVGRSFPYYIKVADIAYLMKANIKSRYYYYCCNLNMLFNAIRVKFRFVYSRRTE